MTRTSWPSPPQEESPVTPAGSPLDHPGSPARSCSRPRPGRTSQGRGSPPPGNRLVQGRLVDRATTRRIVVTRHHHEHDDHASHPPAITHGNRGWSSLVRKYAQIDSVLVEELLPVGRKALISPGSVVPDSLDHCFAGCGRIGEGPACGLAGRGHLYVDGQAGRRPVQGRLMDGWPVILNCAEEGMKLTIRSISCCAPAAVNHPARARARQGLIRTCCYARTEQPGVVRRPG